LISGRALGHIVGQAVAVVVLAVADLFLRANAFAALPTPYAILALRAGVLASAALSYNGCIGCESRRHTLSAWSCEVFVDAAVAVVIETVANL